MGEVSSSSELSLFITMATCLRYFEDGTVSIIREAGNGTTSMDARKEGAY
jgi:hypothetical protein